MSAAYFDYFKRELTWAGVPTVDGSVRIDPPADFKNAGELFDAVLAIRADAIVFFGKVLEHKYEWHFWMPEAMYQVDFLPLGTPMRVDASSQYVIGEPEITEEDIGDGPFDVYSWYNGTFWRSGGILSSPTRIPAFTPIHGFKVLEDAGDVAPNSSTAVEGPFGIDHFRKFIEAAKTLGNATDSRRYAFSISKRAVVKIPLPVHPDGKLCYEGVRCKAFFEQFPRPLEAGGSLSLSTPAPVPVEAGYPCDTHVRFSFPAYQQVSFVTARGGRDEEGPLGAFCAAILANGILVDAQLSSLVVRLADPINVNMPELDTVHERRMFSIIVWDRDASNLRKSIWQEGAGPNGARIKTIFMYGTFSRTGDYVTLTDIEPDAAHLDFDSDEIRGKCVSFAAVLSKDSLRYVVAEYVTSNPDNPPVKVTKDYWLYPNFDKLEVTDESAGIGVGLHLTAGRNVTEQEESVGDGETATVEYYTPQREGPLGKYFLRSVEHYIKVDGAVTTVTQDAPRYVTPELGPVTVKPDDTVFPVHPAYIYKERGYWNEESQLWLGINDFDRYALTRAFATCFRIDDFSIVTIGAYKPFENAKITEEDIICSTRIFDAKGVRIETGSISYDPGTPPHYYKHSVRFVQWKPKGIDGAYLQATIGLRMDPSTPALFDLVYDQPYVIVSAGIIQLFEGATYNSYLGARCNIWLYGEDDTGSVSGADPIDTKQAYFQGAGFMLSSAPKYRATEGNEGLYNDAFYDGTVLWTTVPGPDLAYVKSINDAVAKYGVFTCIGTDGYPVVDTLAFIGKKVGESYAVACLPSALQQLENPTAQGSIEYDGYYAPIEGNDAGFYTVGPIKWSYYVHDPYVDLYERDVNSRLLASGFYGLRYSDEDWAGETPFYYNTTEPLSGVINGFTLSEDVAVFVDLPGPAVWFENVVRFYDDEVVPLYGPNWQGGYDLTWPAILDYDYYEWPALKRVVPGGEYPDYDAMADGNARPLPNIGMSPLPHNGGVGGEAQHFYQGEHTTFWPAGGKNSFGFIPTSAGDINAGKSPIMCDFDIQDCTPRAYAVPRALVFPMPNLSMVYDTSVHGLLSAMPTRESYGIEGQHAYVYAAFIDEEVTVVHSGEDLDQKSPYWIANANLVAVGEVGADRIKIRLQKVGIIVVYLRGKSGLVVSVPVCIVPENPIAYPDMNVLKTYWVAPARGVSYRDVKTVARLRKSIDGYLNAGRTALNIVHTDDLGGTSGTYQYYDTEGRKSLALNLKRKIAEFETYKTGITYKEDGNFDKFYSASPVSARLDNKTRRWNKIAFSTGKESISVTFTYAANELCVRFYWQTSEPYAEESADNPYLYPGYGGRTSNPSGNSLQVALADVAAPETQQGDRLFIEVFDPRIASCYIIDTGYLHP